MFKPYNVAKLKDDWELNKRWQGITRPYSAEDVVRPVSYTHLTLPTSDLV